MTRAVRTARPIDLDCRALIALAALVVVGCTPAGPGDTSPRRQPVHACTTRVDEPARAQAALDDAEPGHTICFTGSSLSTAELTLTRSGTSREPIRLLGESTTIRALTVASDHVVVRGFDLVDGDGLDLTGTGLVVDGNTVTNATEDGISCESCTDARIEQNVVTRADGSGIIVEGVRISVLFNEVSGSVRQRANDADGIRFFGQRHRIRGNIVRDIKDDGYPGEPPHTDCFQTYDNSRRPTTHAEISGNRCVNVDHQCLIATAVEKGRSHSLEFRGNVCVVGGKQALLVQSFRSVDVRHNQIAGAHLERGVALLDGSVGASIFENVFHGSYRFVQADESSRPGLRTGRNTSDLSKQLEWLLRLTRLYRGS